MPYTLQKLSFARPTLVPYYRDLILPYISVNKNIFDNYYIVMHTATSKKNISNQDFLLDQNYEQHHIFAKNASHCTYMVVTKGESH